jgi:hypothetical protein
LNLSKEENEWLEFEIVLKLEMVLINAIVRVTLNKVTTAAFSAEATGATFPNRVLKD